MSSGAVSDAVTRVEQELAKFWSTPDASSGTDAPKVRASTMNFVVAAAASELEPLREQVQAVAEVRSGRMFLLTVDPRREPWDVGSEVVATCRKEGDDVLCHDRVELSFGAMAASRAGSVVSSLTLPEVPVIVEVGRSAPPSLVDAIVRVAGRLVVDSAQTPMARLAALTDKTTCPIGDRAMVRAYQWRDLVARFFDGAPAATRGIRRVTVQSTPGSPQDPAALIFGWLGSRLGWTFESRAVARDAAGSAVALAVGDAARAGLGPGEIVSIEAVAELDGQEMFGRCGRTGDPSIANWSLRGVKEQDHTHALGRRDEAWVLMKAIDGNDDKVTRDTLRAAASWSSK